MKQRKFIGTNELSVNVDVEPEGTLQMLYIISFLVRTCGGGPSPLRRDLSAALRTCPFASYSSRASRGTLSLFLVRNFSAALRAAPSLFLVRNFLGSAAHGDRMLR